MSSCRRLSRSDRNRSDRHVITDWQQLKTMFYRGLFLTLMLIFFDVGVATIGFGHGLSYYATTTNSTPATRPATSDESTTTATTLQKQNSRTLQSVPSPLPPQPVLLFFGTVVNRQGHPMVGSQVQFWHTDGNGRYNHPSDTAFDNLLYTDTFTYMGTSTCDQSGNFYFRTYRPGIYSSRPITHIHFKVWNSATNDDDDQNNDLDSSGNTTTVPSTNDNNSNNNNRVLLLTSQFYFEDDPVAQQRPIDEMLMLNLTEISTMTTAVMTEQIFGGANGIMNISFDFDEMNSNTTNTTSDSSITNMTTTDEEIFWTYKQIVVDDFTSETSITNITFTTNLLRLTPRQAEGPFYPLVDFFDFGNDMTLPYPTSREQLINDDDNDNTINNPVSATGTGTSQGGIDGSTSWSSSAATTGSRSLAFSKRRFCTMTSTRTTLNFVHWFNLQLSTIAVLGLITTIGIFSATMIPL